MALNQIIVSGEARAVAAPQEEKVVNEAEAVAAPEEEKPVNNAEVPARPEKKKRRPRQRERERERKRQATTKETPAVTAGMKKPGLITTDDSYRIHIGNLLKQAGKQVITFVKDTFEKIASKAARETECKRTPKRILKWRAEVAKSDHTRIVKLRAQLVNEAVPEGTTAVSFTPA